MSGMASRTRFEFAPLTGYAIDDGVGVLYRGTTLVEAVTRRTIKAAYWVERGEGGHALRTRLEPAGCRSRSGDPDAVGRPRPAVNPGRVERWP